MNSYIRLDEVITSTQGTCLFQNKTQYQGVGTDTRNDLTGLIFFALAGEQFDAHNFLHKAIEQHAAAIVISKIPPNFNIHSHQITIIQVTDTLKALQDLATYRRLQSNVKIIAVTGSNGKTTTKEFTNSLLSPYYKVHYNKGSFNNHWGVPLTLLEIQPEHQFVITEMGMNHPGEIKELVRIAQPNIVGVTMVGRAHLEGLGSLEAVSLAKEEIYSYVKNPDFGIFNLDNPWTKTMVSRFQTKHPQSQIITFSEVDPQSHVFLNVLEFSIDSILISGHIKQIENSIRLEIFGKHNVVNLMTAIGFALAAGLSPQQIWKALPLCKNIWGRNQKLNLPNNATLIFDAYNANPDSQKALIENIKLLKHAENQKFIGIFGDMKELGTQSCPLHEELGELVASAPFDVVWFIGPHSEFCKKGFKRKANSSQLSHCYQSVEIEQNICLQIKTILNPQDLIVIKGSRGMELEKI